MTLSDEIASAINRHSAENGSNTPDFLLAEYLIACLAAFDAATKARDKWYSIAPSPGWTPGWTPPAPAETTAKKCEGPCCVWERRADGSDATNPEETKP